MRTPLLMGASASGLKELVWSQLKETQQNKSDGGMQQNKGQRNGNWAHTEHYCAGHTFRKRKNLSTSLLEVQM